MAVFPRLRFPDQAPSAELRSWFHGEPGARVATEEHRLLGYILPDLFGYHIVQLGCCHMEDLIASSRVSHGVTIDTDKQGAATAHLRCQGDALPLAAASIDVLVLPHILEFSADPKPILREVARVLIGEGHIVVLGFNPWSFHGLWSLLWRWQGRAPWNGKFISASRVKDWLQILGFDIVNFSRASFLPPLRRAGLNRRLQFIENLGSSCWPYFGNVYLLVGKKRVEGITPLKVGWRQRRRVVSNGVAEPTARDMSRGGCK